jgi:hypothetical protein
MRKFRQLVLVMAAIALLPSVMGAAPKPFQDPPCNPSPRMIIACRNAGGTFNFGLCQCVFPRSARRAISESRAR